MDITQIIYGIFGIILGASAQYFFGLASERRKKFFEKKMQIYSDFIENVSEAAVSGKNNKNISDANLKKITQSKAFISIIGNKDVIRCINIFFDKHGIINSPASLDCFTDIIYAMRTDILKDNSIKKEEIKEILFGNKR